MKNPIRLKINNELKAECGDPFVMRFNGKYYLYPSSIVEPKIHCFVSDDLVNWSQAYVVCEDENITCAYAPEVIYKEGYFYLCTSPFGRGHYIYKSSSPLGPFKRITDNIANMIDGSFALDKNFNLKFYRANHYGIAVSDMDENGHCSNRKNIASAHMSLWTEGPSVTYKDGRYYLTACGNHLESYGYRVNYSVSKEIDNHFENPNYNPLLISTTDKYNSLGHSSTVLAPDLDGYYIVYHHLIHLYDDNKKFIGHTRDFGIDRLHFNGSMLSVTPTYFETKSPCMPTLYEDLQNSCEKFVLKEGKYLSIIKTEKVFTAEYNFKANNTKVILSYIDESNYSYIRCFNNSIQIMNVLDGKKKKVKEVTINVSFNNFHTVRVINSLEYAEILIDNVPVLKTAPFNAGNIGYSKNNNKGLHFTAFSNYSLGNSDLNYPNIIPGRLDALHDYNQNIVCLDNNDDVYYATLKENQEIEFKVQGESDNNYHLSMLLNCNYSSKVLITSKENSITLNIDSVDCEYEYYYKELAKLDLKENDFIKIKVLSGTLMYKSLEVKLTKYKEVIDRKYGLYLTDDKSMYQECEFSFDEFTGSSLFGLLFNVEHYSSHPANPDPSFVGYIVGFKNGLMVVGYANYGFTMVYDKPVKIELNKKYLLSAKVKDSKIEVFLDNKKIIETTLPYSSTYGQVGMYVNNFAKVNIHSYRREKHEEV